LPIHSRFNLLNSAFIKGVNNMDKEFEKKIRENGLDVKTNDDEQKQLCSFG